MKDARAGEEHSLPARKAAFLHMARSTNHAEAVLFHAYVSPYWPRSAVPQLQRHEEDMHSLTKSLADTLLCKKEIVR